MSWNLIRSIQKNTDMRLIMPFGLNLTLGDVISVNAQDGTFKLEGTSASLLGVPVSKVRSPQSAGVSFTRQSGTSTSLTFRGEGAASTLFPQLPNAHAGFDISFDSAYSWVLALTNRQITAIEELDAFRQSILNAYHWRVWKPDWALVTSIATVDRITLIASTTGGTNVALALNGQFEPGAAVEVKLTAGISIVGSNNDIIQSVVDKPSVAFCSAVRVREHWFTEPDVGDLEAVRVPKDLVGAPPEEVWMDADPLE